MKRWLLALLAVALTAVLPVVFVQMAQPAKAASLVQVTNFGNNPSNLQMYIYVPNNVTANPPILLALHQCTGSGPASTPEPSSPTWPTSTGSS
jgi:acetylxylan esterase